ncbi:flagellar motor switch phosphatase FliY [Paenibacillus mesophilus]|uniref:flagellar motor switch phosphatase FliY n=1 Tax=Paenibacillus mesophilus TaxID=2582849 RepID=UPI00110D3EA0|nr:flagellar motor switch phosphatase FliY [Paenibacillus mesophilus]TMV52041.1 flagellar motor switch phosphatase FliY [Paenibacillus mesophilus]
MTSKDYLSQEEIDALLRQTSEDFGGGGTSSDYGSPNVDDYLSPIEQDALGEIGNITFGSAATALSTLLGKKVDITTPKVSVIARVELEKEFPKPHVAIHVNYVDGFDGINLLVIKTKDAQVIADLMMGGTGNVSEDMEMSEIHISAVQEAMNQMMGSSATSMSTIFNRFVNISPPGINILDLQNGEGKENLPREEVFVKISFRLIIGDLIDSTLMQLLPVSFAKDMVSILMGGTGMESEPSYSSPAPDTAPSSSYASTSVSQPDPMAGYTNNAPTPVMPPTQYDPYQQQQQQMMQHQPPMMPPQQPMYQQPMYQQPMYQQQPMYEQPQQMYQQPPHVPANYGGIPGRNVNVQAAQFSNFASPSVHVDETNLNLLLDIPLKVTVELGRTKKLIKDILEFSQGSIIELDKLAGEPVDILVNNKLIAKGEVVVIDENFGVRVTDIISQMDRIQKLQ